MSTPYYTDSGNTIHLGPQIGKGGEGIVYQIHGDKQNVAKIYINQQPSEVHQKILAMVANPPHDPTIHSPTKHHSMAWPLDVLYADRQKLQFAGFIMPFIDTKNFQKILGYLNPKSRKQSFYGTFTWLHLHVTARNLASCIAAIHEKGYCIGDLNESNVLVQPSTPLTIIDCDSFQVLDANSGRVLRCTVGKPEYTAPEIMDSKYSDVDRTPETECFALGVMIFQLLMEGFHPYGARGQLVDNAPNTKDKIKLGIFSYNTGLKGIDPPEDAPSFDILSPDVRSLFIRCFDVGHKNPSVRPTAKEWMSALDKLANNFIACKSNNNHRYLSHSAVCPWCDRLSKFGEEFHSFPSATGIGMQFKLPDPNNQMGSKQEREAFLLTFIEEALLDDGYVSPKAEANLIKRGLKLHISEKETKKLIADEIKRRGLVPGASGRPILSVNKTYFQYRNIKNGATFNETIEIGNVGDGVLTGTISSNAPWIKISGSIAPNMKNQSQKLQLIVDTTNLPYGFSGTGTVSVRTNGNDATISVSLSTEGLSVLTEQFRRSYVPLIAAFGGFAFSFSSSPVSNFLSGAFLSGIISYLFSKVIVRLVLNRGVNIFKLPSILIQGAAAGIVILTITSHSGGSSSVKTASYAPSPASVPSSAPAPASTPGAPYGYVNDPGKGWVPASAPSQIPETPSIIITKAVIAEGFSNPNSEPLGAALSFQVITGERKSLVYYAYYNYPQADFGGNAPGVVKWFKDGSLVHEGCDEELLVDFGNYICKPRFSFSAPGRYEVKLVLDGKELNTTSFQIAELSARATSNTRETRPYNYSRTQRTDSTNKPSGKKSFSPPSGSLRDE